MVIEIWKSKMLMDSEGIPNRGEHEVVLKKDLKELKESLKAEFEKYITLDWVAITKDKACEFIDKKFKEVGL